MNNTPSDYENPIWLFNQFTGDWAYHVSPEIRDAWNTFTKEQKAILARQAYARTMYDYGGKDR